MIYKEEIEKEIKKLKENPTETNRDNLLILLSQCIIDTVLKE